MKNKLEDRETFFDYHCSDEEVYQKWLANSNMETGYPDKIIYEIFPTEKGWIHLEDKTKKNNRLLPKIFERWFNRYKTKNNSFRLCYGPKYCKEEYSEFLEINEFVYAPAENLESPTETYLKVRNETYLQMQYRIKKLVYSEAF